MRTLQDPKNRYLINMTSSLVCAWIRGSTENEALNEETERIGQSLTTIACKPSVPLLAPGASRNKCSNKKIQNGHSQYDQ